MDKGKNTVNEAEMALHAGWQGKPPTPHAGQATPVPRRPQ